MFGEALDSCDGIRNYFNLFSFLPIIVVDWAPSTAASTRLVVPVTTPVANGDTGQWRIG